MKITSSQATIKSSSTPKKIFNFNFPIICFCVFSLLSAGIITHIVTKTYFPNGVTNSIRGFFVDRGLSTYQHSAKSYKKDISLLVKKVTNIPSQIFNGTDIPKIYIDIKFKHLQKIYKKRNQALKDGFLIQGDDDFVPARIRLKNGELAIKLRLKGDFTDHLEGNKWSFRIHTKGKSHLFGLRRFSIQHPKVRGFQGEALIHEVFSQFGILSPTYSFVEVVINGEDIGIMALEEHFSKELLERNGRKEGVIIRLDESLFWNARNRSRSLMNMFDNYLIAPIDAFQSSKINASEHLSREYKTAVGLLRGFTNNQLEASEVFDSELMGRYLAIAQFFGLWHEILWNNQRFYFNSITQKLEPIAFDANMQEARPTGFDIFHDTIHKDYFSSHLLKDKKLHLIFQNTLEQLAKSINSGSLIQSLQKIEQPLLKILQKEFFFLESIDYKELKERALNIPKLDIENKYAIDPSVFPQFIQAFSIETNKNNHLELLNILPYEIEIQSIYWSDKAGNKLPFNSTKTLKFPIILEKTNVKGKPKPLYIEYSPAASNKLKLMIISNIQGTSFLKTTKAQKYYPALNLSPRPKGDIGDLLSKKPYLFLEDKKTIAVKKGHWKVQGKIIIPEGFDFKISGNTHLQFEPDGCIVVYGNAYFLGSPNEPIVLDGINSTWQGLVVFQADNRSKWSYVNILNTTGIDFPLWKLTGGVTFYRSDVDIDNSIFSGNLGEDALNIVHSNFTLNNVDITNTQSDGFDGDFVTGTIIGGKFQDIGKAGGGDGVDISGSKISLAKTYFNRISDKAISVGENSTMSVENAKIDTVSIAAASKDKSSLNITHTQIVNAYNVALMAYVKKPEFGHARLTAKQTEITKSKNTAIVQQGSFLELNGKDIEPKQLNVKQLYQTIMKPGMRK